LRYTPTHAVQQEPMKSARKAKSFRLASDGVVHRSRTITRTISPRWSLPFGLFTGHREIVLGNCGCSVCVDRNVGILMHYEAAIAAINELEVIYKRSFERESVYVGGGQVLSGLTSGLPHITGCLADALSALWIEKLVEVNIVAIHGAGNNNVERTTEIDNLSIALVGAGNKLAESKGNYDADGLSRGACEGRDTKTYRQTHYNERQRYSQELHSCSSHFLRNRRRSGDRAGLSQTARFSGDARGTEQREHIATMGIVNTDCCFANQRNHCRDGQNADRNTVSPQFSHAAHSDCIPDVLLQVIGLMQVIFDCPRTVRVLEAAARGN